MLTMALAPRGRGLPPSGAAAAARPPLPGGGRRLRRRAPQQPQQQARDGRLGARGLPPQLRPRPVQARCAAVPPNAGPVLRLFFWCPPASFCGHLLPCMLAQWGVSPAGLPDMRTSGQYDCSLGQLGTMRTLSRLLPAVDERDRVECSILLEEASVLACVRTQAHHNLTCRDISDGLRVNSGRAARGGRRPPALDPPARRQASRLHRGRR